MRNIIIGGVLVVVLVAGLLAAALWSRHHGASLAPDPAKTAAAIPADFVGEKDIGDWHLACGEPRALPRPPGSDGNGGNSQGTPPKDQAPPGFMLPRCHLAVVRKSTAGNLIISFRQVGFKRVLTLFVRTAPDAVQSGDSIDAHFDKNARPILMRCASLLCLGVTQFRKGEQPIVLRAATMKIAFKAATGPVTVDLSTAGLADAIRTMQRINR